MTPNKRKFHICTTDKSGGTRATAQLNPAWHPDSGSITVTLDGPTPSYKYYYDAAITIRDCYRSIELSFGMQAGRNFSEQEFQARIRKIELLRQGLDMMEKRLIEVRDTSKK